MGCIYKAGLMGRTCSGYACLSLRCSAMQLDLYTLLSLHRMTPSIDAALGSKSIHRAGKGADLERLVGDLKLVLSKPWGFQAENGRRPGRWEQKQLMCMVCCQCWCGRCCTGAAGTSCLSNVWMQQLWRHTA